MTRDVIHVSLPCGRYIRAVTQHPPTCNRLPRGKAASFSGLMASYGLGSRVRVEGFAASAVVQMETSTQLLVRIDGREHWVPRNRAVLDPEVRSH